MNNRNWSNPFDYSGGSMPNQPQQLPTQMSPSQYEPTRVSPTRHFVQRNETNTIVPNVHPSHLTTINEHYRHHQHYFPHTNSVVNRCYETHTMCGTPFHPWNCGCKR